MGSLREAEASGLKVSWRGAKAVWQDQSPWKELRSGVCRPLQWRPGHQGQSEPRQAAGAVNSETVQALWNPEDLDYISGTDTESFILMKFGFAWLGLTVPWIFLLGVRRYVTYFLFYIKIVRSVFYIYVFLFLHSFGSHSLSPRVPKISRLIFLYNLFTSFSHKTNTPKSSPSFDLLC